MDINRNLGSDLVSIIVPIYNVEKYLGKCIETLISQTYKNIEIILVNDGSQDGSLEICKKYAEKDSRIQIINKQNGGLSDARNHGKKVAKGEYLVFVDSDDYIHRQMIEVLYKKMKKTHADIAICNKRNVYEQDNIQDEVINLDKVSEQLYSKREALAELFGEHVSVFTVAWNKMYNKKVFENIEYPVGKIHEDEFVAYRLLYNAERVIYIDIEMYYYLQRDNSIMGQSYSEKRFFRVEAWKQRVDFFIKEGFYVSEALKWYYWAFQDFIINYKKAFPKEKKMIKEYNKKYVEACKEYRGHLSLAEYLKLRLKSIMIKMSIVH